MVNFTKFAKSIQYKNVYSQFGEDGVIEAIFDKIGVENRWCVECGAADGLFFSNTRRLIEQGWDSIQIEADPKAYAKLKELYSSWNPGGVVYTINERVTNFEKIFETVHSLPKDFDLLVIDVDGQDYHLWNQLLSYQPRVVICEYDPNEDVDYIPTIGGEGQAGERAIHHVALARGYQVVCKTWCNLICVRNDLCHLLTEEVPTGLNALGAMIPVKEDPLSADDSDEPAPLKEAGGLWGGFTEQDFIDAKAEREQEGKIMFAAAMSTPRWGPISTMVTIQSALAQWNVPFFSTEGAYWHHHITEAIERGLRTHPDFILTFDYDSLFCPLPNFNDIAKLITLMVDNPDVDVIAPLQLQREGGAPIANSDSGDLELAQPLAPVWFAHFGMTLFRASVFEKIEKPWFWEKANPEGGWGEGRIDPDTGFWLRCKDAGLKVCIALDIVLGHGEYGPTFPDDRFQPIRMSGNEWRKNGMRPPANAFNRQRVIEAALKGEYAGAKVNGAVPERKVSADDSESGWQYPVDNEPYPYEPEPTCAVERLLDRA